MHGYVYVLRLNKSPKYYIGSTDTIERRSYHHLTFLKAGSHLNRLLQEEWNRSGSDDISISWQEFPTYEEAYREEQARINSCYGDPLCCNISVGGYSLANHPDRDEIHTKNITKRADILSSMSAEQRKERFSMKGEANPNYGKARPSETIEKIRQSNLVAGLGKPKELKDTERSERMQGSGNHFYGRKHSEETKAKLSESMKNRETVPLNAKAISINGVVYESQAAAAKELQVCSATITHRLKSNNPRYAEYKTITQEKE